jgi:hypothetical protein
LNLKTKKIIFKIKEELIMIKIFLPNTPSKFVGKPKVYKIKKILMTCGGGMGGRSWDEYVLAHTFPSDLPEGLFKVLNYKGEEVVLNAKYIVKIIDKYMIGISVDSQNSYCGVGITTYYYESPTNNFKLTNEFGNTDNQKEVGLIDTIRGKLL